MPEPQKKSPRTQTRRSRWISYCLGVFTGCLLTGSVLVYVNRAKIPLLNDRFIVRDDITPLQKDEKWDPNTVLLNTDSSPLNTNSEAETVTQSDELTNTTATHAEQSNQLGLVLKSRDGKPIEILSNQEINRTDQLKVEQEGMDKLVSSVTSFQTGETSATREYFLQVGAFRNSQEAQAQRTQLELSGIRAQIKEVKSVEATLYRVQAGPFTSQAEVQNARQQISRLGLSPFEVTGR